MEMVSVKTVISSLIVEISRSVSTVGIIFTQIPSSMRTISLSARSARIVSTFGNVMMSTSHGIAQSVVRVDIFSLVTDVIMYSDEWDSRIRVIRY